MNTPKRKLKFRFQDNLETIPNGYRLATVEEVRNHKNTIARLGIPPLHGRHYSIEEGTPMYLLDGYMTYPSHERFQLQQTFQGFLNWKIVVKEWFWSRSDGWMPRDSASYPSDQDSIHLRMHVYHHLTLSPQGRKTALLNHCCHCLDVEVLYLLLKTKSSLSELEEFKSSFNKQSYKLSTGALVRCLLNSTFPKDLDANSLDLDAILYFAQGESSKETVIRAIELLKELFSPRIVDLKNSEGLSFLAWAGNQGFFHIFTKLLAVSPNAFEIHRLRITLSFREVFSEAFKRGYIRLLKTLLHFLRDMSHTTIDVPLLIVDLSEAVERKHDQLLEKLLDIKVNEQINMDEFVEVFEKAVCKGHRECLQKLLELLVSKVDAKHVMEVDRNDKTLIHYAAESGNAQVFHILVQKLQSHVSNLQGAKEESENIVKNRDKFGRSILHWSALVGEANSCEICVKDWKLKVESKDSSGQNPLHFAAKGNLGHQVVDLLIKFSSKELIHSTDYKGSTPLHLAAAFGNIKMVQKLLDLVGVGDSQSQLRYIQQSDSFGRTTLHMAVRGGHQHLAKLLLEKGSDPLKERDMHGQTSLHYATQVEDPEVAVSVSTRLLDKYGPDPANKSLLMWASAAGIGTAEEKEQMHRYVRDFIENEKASDETHLLRAAAVTNNVQMAWELVNRGARLADLHHDYWRKSLSTDKEENVENVIKQIALANKRGHDKPSLEDKLGRYIFAEGLAALFLNKFISSPITVGISGEWGMGKSSLMIQTEQILLMAASQLTFPNLLMFEKFEGADEISLSNKGVHIYQKFEKGMAKLLLQEGKYSSQFQRENALVNLLQNYQSQYHEIYKSIACMDQNQMLKPNPTQSIIQSPIQVLKRVPRILTIHYNAWHYRNEKEAWAGLSVRISEEIEKLMTRAQWLATCWKYTWNLHRMTICLQVFVPCFFTIFLAGWVAWGGWILGKIKEITFGSIPCAVVAIVGVVLKSVVSVVKPVSVQMMGYITSPDHSSSLGYQQKVISDINFLKKELGRKPGWVFSFLAGEWCCNWFGLYPDNIENTCIPKIQPASEDQIRIITFVDDLDRCEEKVILQVLSAINLVLAECDINVILGIDKKMIERAIKKNFQDNDDGDLAERFISKIIQIPLSLPDPTEEELINFLESELGHPPSTITAAQDGGETDYGEIESDEDVEEENSIGCRGQSNVNRNTEDFISFSVADEENATERNSFLNYWVARFLSFKLVVCNISNKLWRFRYSSNTEKIHPLTFSKGARLSREMLLSNYSKEEANIFYELGSFATDNQKLPREWKRLLNYHKLAYNILSRQGKVYSLPHWKEQLVAWIFVCWKWKHEMNIVFKAWHKFAVVRITKEAEDEDENHERWHGPSLKTIVTNYINNKLDDSLHYANSNVEGKQDNQSYGPKEKDCSRQDPSITAILSPYRYDITSVKEDESFYPRWLNLQAALDKQDVSMKGIQLFQQFRLHCATCHLPWPLPQSNQWASSYTYMEL